MHPQQRENCWDAAQLKSPLRWDSRDLSLVSHLGTAVNCRMRDLAQESKADLAHSAAQGDPL